MAHDFVGVRVTGDRRWNGKEPNTGYGYLGTIIKCAKWGTKTYFTVQWDSGIVTEIEQPGPDVLVIQDARALGQVHGVTCCWCNDNIKGFLWNCIVCDDKNLCNSCYHGDKHDLKHQFQRCDTASERVLCNKCDTSTHYVVWHCATCIANICNTCYDRDERTIHRTHNVDKKKIQRRSSVCRLQGSRSTSKKITVKGLVKGADVTLSKLMEDDYARNCTIPKMLKRNGKMIGLSLNSEEDRCLTGVVRWQRALQDSHYRVGYNGRVDIKFTKPAGMTCYPYHLPCAWELLETLCMLQLPSDEEQVLEQKAPDVRLKHPEPDQNLQLPSLEHKIAVVQRHFKASKEGELSLNPGNIVLSVSTLEDGVLYGNFCGQSGSFPEAHVEVTIVLPGEYKRLLTKQELELFEDDQLSQPEKDDEEDDLLISFDADMKKSEDIVAISEMFSKHDQGPWEIDWPQSVDVEETKPKIPSRDDAHDVDRENAAAMKRFEFSKVAAHEEPSCGKSPLFNIGDKVTIELDPDVVVMLQEGHGGFDTEMTTAIGKIGTVIEAISNGDMRVAFGTKCWTVNPVILTPKEENVNPTEETTSRQEEPSSRQNTEYLCPICQDRNINVVFNCGHHTCDDCSKFIDNCHACRQPIVMRTRLFLHQQ